MVRENVNLFHAKFKTGFVNPIRKVDFRVGDALQRFFFPSFEDVASDFQVRVLIKVWLTSGLQL